MKYAFAFFIAAILFSCKKETKTFSEPIVNAGFDRLVILPVDNAELTGSGWDPDGNTVSYKWRNLSGPAIATIESPTQLNTKVKNMIRGIYEFELKINNDHGFFAVDKAFVVVVDSLNDPLNISCMGCWDY